MTLTGVLAHGVGSRGTLPLPLWQFSWAASAALVLSFVALGVLWKEAKLEPLAIGRPITGSASAVRALTGLARLTGLGLFALTLFAAFAGEDDEVLNLAPVTIYVILWVGVPVVSLLFGDVWRGFNPFRTIGLAFPEQTAKPAPGHHWWAAGLLGGFLVLELVHPSGASPRILGWAMVVYALVMIAGMSRHGRAWLDSADGFGVLFGLIAAIAPLFVDREGRLAWRPPLSGLHSVDVRAGTTLLILGVLGGTSFDGFSESPLFTDIIGRPTGWSAAPPKFIGLIALILIATVLYWVGAKTTASVAGISHERAAAMFAPSLVPIVLGYAVAHYAQLLLDETQSFWFRLADPLGGNGEAADINLNLFNADAIAWVQALAIVFGHVAGVVFAHDLAVANFDSRKAARSQQTMLVVMVIYSVAGLWLLFSA
ncbi:MAG: hypothetical protein HKN94_14070 [Acidimicrobiales bacterium]|nr:hypothetical protein [Acidimicrobiales bacterium]RZV43747.1 MAG: hypothetical protein EX269_12735 [Acidimicrobiales bacterium]